MLELSTLTVIAICLRLLVVRKAPVDFDLYGHLYFSKEVTAQKKGPFREIITKVVGSTGFSQPFLWHWLVGFFPATKILQYQKWINAFIDALFSIFIYLLALNIHFDKQTAAFMAMLYLLTPMWFSRLSVGPRISNFTPRLVSELSSNLFFIVTLLPFNLPVWLVLLLGAFLSAFGLLSSKFGLQALLFLTPLTSLIAWTPIPMIALLVGFALSLCLSQGLYLKSISTQIRHLIWYFKKNLKKEMVVSERNSWAKLFRKPSSGEGRVNYVLYVLFRSISINSYTSVLLKMPLLILTLGLFVFAGLSGENYPPIFITAPLGAATILYFLVNIPALLFLGEAERYLNHVAFFIVTTATMLAISMGQEMSLLIVLGYGLVYWFVESFFLHKIPAARSQADKHFDNGVISHLNSLKNPVVVLVYPYNALGVWRIMLETPHNTIYVSTTSKEFSEMFDQKYAAEYPYVKLEKLDEMAEHLGVRYLVANRKHLALRGLKNWVPSSQWHKLGAGEPVYDVYQRTSDS